MAADHDWPDTLPCFTQLQGLVFEPRDESVIEVEQGEPMTRRRNDMVIEDFSGTLLLKPTRTATSVQMWTIAYTFWRDTLKNGTRRFNAKHPISGAAVEVLFLKRPRTTRDGAALTLHVSACTLPSE